MSGSNKPNRSWWVSRPEPEPKKKVGSILFLVILIIVFGFLEVYKNKLGIVYPQLGFLIVGVFLILCSQLLAGED